MRSEPDGQGSGAPSSPKPPLLWPLLLKPWVRTSLTFTIPSNCLRQVTDNDVFE
jgi:hypothetical protein